MAMAIFNIAYLLAFLGCMVASVMIGWRILQETVKRADKVESVLNDATFKRLEKLETIVNDRMLLLTEASLTLAKMLKDQEQKHADS